MSNEWLKDLLTWHKKAINEHPYLKKEKKLCQWVDNATVSRACSGIVSAKGTIYCSYHTSLWKELKENTDAD